MPRTTTIAEPVASSNRPPSRAEQTSIALDSLDFGLLAINAENEIIFLNRVAEGILKLNSDDVLGREIGQVLRTPRKSTFLVYDPDQVSQESFQRVRRVRDRQRIALRSRTLPLRNDEGDVVGTAALFTEANEISEDELHADRDRLMSLGELSASVAHEIRNPLTGIRTTIQFVQSKLGDKSKYKRELDDVVHELDRIDQIITELLLFGRPQPVRLAAIEVNPLVQKTLDALASKLDEHAIQLKAALAAELPAVVGDSDMIGQVLFNLVANAIEAMPEGGELRLATSVRTSPSGKQRVNVFVSDVGSGVPADIMDKIFDPFFTTRSLGTGLGLSISEQIVRAHGGTLTFRNRRPTGATFRVSLPVDRPEAGSA